MKNSHYGVVELNDIASELVDELVPLAMQEFGCSGSQNQEVNIDNTLNIDGIPEEILTMSGEFTEDQSRFVDQHFFSNVQKVVYFFFEGEVVDITSKANLFIEFIKNELNISAKLVIHKNVEWRDSYKEFFSHAEINDDLVVIPEWNLNNPEFEKYPKKLLIIPGMGFGTGGHETTRLCLKFLNKMQKVDRVLDLGCGSGVLGNYCELYLDSKVDYVDVDQDALDNCNDNRKLNNLDKYGQIYLRNEYDLETKYDLVIANILKPVLELESDLIFNAISNHGQIIFSGLLATQYEDLLNFYRNKFKCDFSYEVLQENDWVALFVYNFKR